MKTIFLALYSAAAILSCGTARAQSESLAARAPADGGLSQSTWDVSGTQLLAVTPPPKTVEALARRLLGSEANLCSFKFADLSDDQFIELVASIDFSGRKFCNTILVVKKISGVFHAEQTEAWGVDNVGDVIVSIDGGKGRQLVIPKAISAYEGTGCVATWPAIYAYDGARLVDSTQSFQSFYQQKILSLAGKIASAQANTSISESENDNEVACLQMQQDKIKRVLGIDAKAGLDSALDWAQSNDSLLRGKAVSVFADIADAESLDRLKALTSDPDTGVAASARIALRNRAWQ